MSDEDHRALSDATRRRVLETLRDRGPLIDLTGATGETPIYRKMSAEFEIDLYHNHLPKFDDMGFIEWDPERDTVDRVPRFEEVQPLLELLDERDGDPE